MPRKRICPSFIFTARSNTPRHVAGLNSGSRPSATNISANAPSSTSQALTGGYFLAPAVPGGAAEPRIALKNSLLESTIMMSDLLRKLARYASSVR